MTTTIPRVEPVILTQRAEPFNDSAWLFEPKYDGFRGLLHITRDSAHFISKRGNRMKRFQVLADLLRPKLKVRDAILDGEPAAAARYYLRFAELWKDAIQRSSPGSRSRGGARPRSGRGRDALSSLARAPEPVARGHVDVGRARAGQAEVELCADP